MNTKSSISKLFRMFPDIRYVAIYQNDKLSLNQKNDLKNSSSNISDRFEELLVNPTLLKLTSQRGNIDCGGLNYLIICYGNFYQLIKEISDGHISISLNKKTNLDVTPKKIIEFIEA